MHTLTRIQQPAESVEEYVADFRSKMHNFGYNDALQMTLVLNGLRSDIKAIAMQHLPYDNLDALVTKARHIEAALKSYNAVQSTLHNTGTSGFQGGAVNAIRQDQDIESAIQKAIEPLNNKLSAIMKQGGRNRYDGPPQQNSSPRYFQQSSSFRQQAPTSQRFNPPGNRRCYVCDSRFHLRDECPHSSDKKRGFAPRANFQNFKRGPAPPFRAGEKPYNKGN